MGAKLCGTSESKLTTGEFLAVREQNMLMDNDEVRVMHIDGQKMYKGHKLNIFDGNKQRKSHFVIPQIDSLRKQKIDFKN